MKKLLALVTVVALMLGMIVPAGAAIEPSGTVVTKLDVGSDFESNGFVTSEGRRFEVAEYAFGIGGKDADDEVIKVIGLDDPTSDSNTWYHDYGSSVNATSGYVVMSVDLFVVDGVSSFHFGARGNTAINQHVSITNEMKNRWVNITAVYNTEAISTDTYVDGNIVSSSYTPGNFRGYNGSDTTQISGTVRWILSGEIGGVSYMDNFKLYTCSEEPVVEQSFGLTDHLYDASVEVAEGLSFADALALSDTSASMTIYADRTYTSTLKTTDELVDSSYIVIKKDGEIRTYMVYVDDGIDIYDSVDNGQFSFVNATVEYETTMGMFGKEADDNSAKIVKDDSLIAFSEYTWLSDDFSGYIRADFNIEAGNVTSVSIGTDSNEPVSGNLTLNANQWNRVSVVYDTTGYDTSTGLGTAVTYVNGVKQSEMQTPFYNLRHLRVLLEGETGSYAYVDDFTMTHYDGKVAVPDDAAIPSNATIANGTAYFTAGAAVSDITSNIPGTIIRVYSDVNFTSELESTATLAAGNYVVMETLGKVYSYYPVALADANTLVEVTKVADVSANKLNPQRGKLTSVFGFGGKAASDESIKMELSSIGANKETDTYFYYSWPDANDARYVVTEFNVFPNDASAVRLLTNGHAAMSGNIPLVSNQWNKAVVVYDTQNAGSVQVYVNGEFVRTQTTTFAAGKTIRLSISCGEVGKSMYIDDFKVYETDGGAVITMPDLNNYYDVASDGSVTVDGGTTISDLVAGELVLRAYTDNTYSSEVLAVDELSDGNILVAEDVYKSLSYYSVVTNVEKNILGYSYDGTLNGISAKDYTAAAGGAFGREASDMAAEFTIGKTSGATDVYPTFSYSNPVSDGYLVFEATAYVKDTYANIQLGTGQHTPLTNKTTFTPGTDYRINQWNKFMYVYNNATRYGELYINGVKVAEKTAPDKFLSTSSEIRFIIYGSAGDKVYIDDMVAYTTNVYPDAGKPAQVSANMKYVLYDYELFMTSATEYSDIHDMFQIADSTIIRFLDSNNNIIEVSEGDTLPEDAMYMTLYTGKANYTAYNVRVTDYYNGVVYGPAYNDENGSATTGTLKVAVPIENLSKECVVAVAAYDSDDNMKDVWLYKADTTSMYINCDVPVDATQYDRVSVMVLDNMENITPYADVINVPVQ